MKDLRYSGHSVCMREITIEYDISVEKPQGKRQYLRPKHRFINRNITYKMDRIQLARDWILWRDFINTVINLRVP
jgi:hypothetical protein